MAGHYLQHREELGHAIKGAWGVTVIWPWSPLVRRNSPVAGRDTLPYRQGFRLPTEQGIGCV